MHTILAIDTSTTACSVAIKNGDQLIEQFKVAPREHTNLILKMIEDLLTEAGYELNQINAIGFGHGPGSFTGLRIAASITQAIAVAHNIPVIPVSTLRAIAQEAKIKSSEIAYVAMDARMDEVYFGKYQLDNNNIMQLIGEETRVDINEIKTEKNTVKIGSMWGEAQEVYPHAKYIAIIAEAEFITGDTVTAEKGLPNYLAAKIAG